MPQALSCASIFDQMVPKLIGSNPVAAAISDSARRPLIAAMGRAASLGKSIVPLSPSDPRVIF
mgnify:CR=1 FL=1